MAPQPEWFEKDFYKVLGVSDTATAKDITPMRTSAANGRQLNRFIEPPGRLSLQYPVFGPQPSLLDRSAECIVVGAGQQGPGVVVVELAGQLHVRCGFSLPQRHHVGPAAAQMRP